MDTVHSAGSRTWPFLHDNGMVGAHLSAPAAPDAFILVNMGTAIGTVNTNRILWTYLHAGVGQAALAAVCHNHPLLMAGIAGKLDH